MMNHDVHQPLHHTLIQLSLLQIIILLLLLLLLLLIIIITYQYYCSFTDLTSNFTKHVVALCWSSHYLSLSLPPTWHMTYDWLHNHRICRVMIVHSGTVNLPGTIPVSASSGSKVNATFRVATFDIRSLNQRYVILILVIILYFMFLFLYILTHVHYVSI